MDFRSFVQTAFSFRDIFFCIFVSGSYEFIQRRHFLAFDKVQFLLLRK